MNDDRIPLDEDRTLPDALRWQLRAMRRDVPPAPDLWPGIAARLAAPPKPSPRRAPWLALAASVLLAVGAGSLVQQRMGDAPDAVARREARQMTREYTQALESMPPARPAGALASGIAELDRSARQIRNALDRDPDSRLLLEQLRRTYTLRLALSQRALVG